MFERFTDRARRAMVLSQETARLHRSPTIDTEHLFAGLAAEDEGVAATALRDLGVTYPAITDLLAARVPAEQVESPKTLPFTPMAKKVLELSLREALQLGHNYIATEHMLLGIIREGTNGAAEMLVNDFGVPLAVVRRAVINRLAQYRQHADEVAAAERAAREDIARGPQPTAFRVTFPSRATAEPLLNWLARYADQHGPLASGHPAILLYEAIADGEDIF